MPDSSNPPKRQSILKATGQAVASPVAAGGGSQNVLPCHVNNQKAHNWCWAAVSEGLGRFFGTSTKNQCTIATDTLGAGHACCIDKGPCDITHLLQPPLLEVGLQGDYYYGSISFNDLKAIIDSGSPFAITITWAGGSNHFIVVNGWLDQSTGSGAIQSVFVQDSLGSFGQVSYQSLVSNYGNQQSSGGSWRDYYLVSVAPGGPAAGGGIDTFELNTNLDVGLTASQMSALVDTLDIASVPPAIEQPVKGG